MVQPLSDEKKRLVVKLYAAGKSYDDIAAQAKVGKGSITGIVAEERLKAPDIDSLREQAQSLKGRSVAEVTRNAAYHESFDSLGIAPDKAPLAIALCEKYGDKAGDVLEKGLELVALAEEHDMSYEDLIDDYGVMLADLERSRKEEKKFLSSIRHLKQTERIEAALRAHGLTDDDLSPFLELHLRLQSLGFTPETADALASELKKLRLAPREAAGVLARMLTGYRSAEEALRDKEWELTKKGEELERTELALEGANGKLRETRRLQEQSNKELEDTQRINSISLMNLRAEHEENIKASRLDYRRRLAELRESYEAEAANIRGEHLKKLKVMDEEIEDRGNLVQELDETLKSREDQVATVTKELAEIQRLTSQATRDMDAIEARINANPRLRFVANMLINPATRMQIPRKEAITGAQDLLLMASYYFRAGPEIISNDAFSQLLRNVVDGYQVLRRELDNPREAMVIE